MEITTTGKLKYRNDGYTEQLRLIVKFRLPNRMFRVKKVKILTNTSRFDTYLEFQNMTLKYLNNKEVLNEIAEKVVLDYMNEKYLNSEEVKNWQSIKKLIKNSNEIKITVKIN